MRRVLDRQCPQQRHPEFDVPRAHPAACPGPQQSKTGEPYFGATGEVRDYPRCEEGKRAAVWDLPRAQVVKTDSKGVKEQPDHWLLMIFALVYWYGGSVGLNWRTDSLDVCAFMAIILVATRPPRAATAAARRLSLLCDGLQTKQVLDGRTFVLL